MGPAMGPSMGPAVGAGMGPARGPAQSCHVAVMLQPLVQALIAAQLPEKRSGIVKFSILLSREHFHVQGPVPLQDQSLFKYHR